MKRMLLAATLMCLLANTALADDFSGPADVTNGDTLTVAGTTVHLAGIAAPPLDQWCQRNDKAIPCGVIARGALLDLVTAMTVTCRLTGTMFQGRPDAVCNAGGFEINANMIYTGWALPLPGTDFEITRDGARQDQRGLWATNYVRY